MAEATTNLSAANKLAYLLSRLYNNFNLILQSTPKYTIYNIQAKFGQSRIFSQKAKIQTFWPEKMWSTWIFQPNIQSMDVHNLKKRTTAAQIVKKKDNLPFKRN